ncbi:MAG TPA: alpha-amylase family glycosyl hydrolase, partial [Solirubrobacteraceae bacterium]|nr:alpha-amylase family glycosyl hydrolase [Solirubrobacteraceae bacterium]
MSLRFAAIAGGVLVTFAAAAPAPAPAAVPAEAAAKRAAKLRILRVSAPSRVQAGNRIAVRGRVANAKRRRAARGKLSFSLRTTRTARRGIGLRHARSARTRPGRMRPFTVRMRIPSGIAPRAYFLRACVRTTGRANCRSRRLTVTPRPGKPPATPVTPSPDPGQGQGGDPPLSGARSLRAPVTDEHFYFVMADRFENGSSANDTGGLAGDRMTTGYDPTHKGFYHGGDLQGLLQRIDYIQGLGTTSIWLTPSFKNKAVQPEDGSAGYHGYWITDFTQIDPHLGTNADLRALVDAAHARGMKVYFDIITNHTADVIGYAEGARRGYVSKDAEPYRDASGTPFDDRDFAGTDSFPALDPAVSFPYTPVLEPGEQNLKVPAWLNDVTLYHNRGDTTFVGEDALYGDFFGLDDLFTEHPRVVDGMVDIYTAWIRDFGIDGFRIDTMKHVNDEFWQEFLPEVLQAAHAAGKPEFFMFGEVFDTTKPFTSHFTTRDRAQAVLDFPFQEAARRFAAQSAPTDVLRDFFVGDDWYTDADSNAYQLPTFLGNHDMGRIGHFVKSANAGAG